MSATPPIFLKSMFCTMIMVPFTLLCFGQSSSTQKSSKYLIRLMKTDSVPGAALTVVKNGRIICQKYLGQANLEQGIPVNKNSVFQIASVSKQFTAAAVMLLAKEGKIGLESPISQYLNEAPVSWKNITITNLLAHCSGLMNYEDISGFNEKAYLDSAHAVVLQSILNSLYKQKLRFLPGTRSEYCNSNYFVLGAIIEKVTGDNFENFLKKRILSRLDMHNTQINEMYNIVKNRVAGYTTLNHKLVNADRLGMDWFFAEGNIITTMNDLVKWVQVPDANKLLDSVSLNKMLSATKLSDGSAGKFGFGWFVDIVNPRITYHSGHTPGFSTFVYRDAFKKTEIVLLMNNDNIPTPKLLNIAKKIDRYFSVE